MVVSFGPLNLQVPNSEADLWRSVKAPTLLDDEDESDGSVRSTSVYV